MAEERQKPGFVHTVTKKAMAPIVASASTALTAFLIRKATEVWEEKLQPKVEEKGGGRAVARETLESAAAKVGGPAAEKLEELAAKVGDDESPSQAKASSAKASSAKTNSPKTRSATSSSSGGTAREKERRKREQRRQQRRRSLDQAGSS